jgi:hypothetical protein
MTGDQNDGEAPPQFEVGATDSNLRFWRAREALRQAELRLAAQAGLITAIEARATALMGWAVAAALAAVAAYVAQPERATTPAAAAAAALALAFALALAAVWARCWATPGFEPAALLDSDLGSELEEIEAMTLGLGEGIRRNDRRLDQAAWLLRGAWIAFGTSPAVTFAAARLEAWGAGS